MQSRVTVLAGGDIGPVLERAEEGARPGEAEQARDVVQREVGTRQVFDRGVAPQVVLDLVVGLGAWLTERVE